MGFGAFDPKCHTHKPVCSVIPVRRAILYNSWIFLFTYFSTVFLQSATNYELLYLPANVFGRVSMVYKIPKPYGPLKVRMKLGTQPENPIS